MSLFMDVHAGLGDATEEDIQAAHERDLEIQGKYGVQFLTYWVNNPDGLAFCLVEAPDQDTLVACHKEAHGLLPHNIIEVKAPVVSQFLGDWKQNVPNRAVLPSPGSAPDTGLRAIMFTDIEGSTDISTSRGDDAAIEMIRNHDSLARSCLTESGGREVKHTGDGIFASFSLVTKAVECSVAIQRRLEEHRHSKPDDAFSVRIGISAGEPVTKSDDLFGAAVNLAARICGYATADQILVSSAVRELSIGKSLEYIGIGPVALKGFPEAVQLYEVPWAN